MYIDNDGSIHGHSTCLWEAMVHCASREDRTGKAYEKLLQELGNSACMHYQEIGISGEEDGWHIYINSQADHVHGRVEILIPKDHNKRARILMDTRGMVYPNYSIRKLVWLKIKRLFYKAIRY